MTNTFNTNEAKKWRKLNFVRSFDQHDLVALGHILLILLLIFRSSCQHTGTVQGNFSDFPVVLIAHQQMCSRCFHKWVCSVTFYKNYSGFRLCNEFLRIEIDLWKFADQYGEECDCTSRLESQAANQN